MNRTLEKRCQPIECFRQDPTRDQFWSGKRKFPTSLVIVSYEKNVYSADIREMKDIEL